MVEQGTVVGAYRIEGVLGRGGMGVVYSARHAEVGRQVALKVLAGELSSDPEFVARFRREGRLQASLAHPHVLTVYDAGESDSGLYIAMQLVSGSTLATLIRDGTLDAARALQLLRQVGEALDTAHGAGLVHRDVKPQNVLVSDAGDAYLSDFGLTRLGTDASVTATGSLLGTVLYLAPEIVRGQTATPASDRYSFAATVFECLTGTVVFPRRTEAATLYAHTSEPPPRISQRRAELPHELDSLFERALSKQPRDRPKSAARFVDSVADVLAETGLTGLGPPPPAGVEALDSDTADTPASPGRTDRRRRRSPVLWAVAAALAGAVVGATIAAVVASGDDDDPPPEQAVPAPLAGAKLLGSDLEDPGRTLDCRGAAPTPRSTGCTIVQSALPGHTLVVPEDGVIRRWSVRSAQGELALSVVRPRGEAGPGQIARSRNEFAGNDGIHTYNANIAVSRGDLVGLVSVPGSGVGAVPGVAGATTKRWLPVLNGSKPPDLEAGTGWDNELLFRVEYVPGGQQQLPEQLSGAAAADAPRGVDLERRRLTFSNGRRVQVALVEVNGRFVLDEFIDGRRTARIAVPDFIPSEGGNLVDFEVYAEDAPQELGVYMEYINQESARVLQHFYSVFPNAFQFVN